MFTPSPRYVMGKQNSRGNKNIGPCFCQKWKLNTALYTWAGYLKLGHSYSVQRKSGQRNYAEFRKSEFRRNLFSTE